SQRGSPTALTDIKGRVLANGWHYGLKERVSLVIHSSLLQTIAQHLGRYMVFSKSTLSQDSNEMDITIEHISQSIVLDPMGWKLIPRSSVNAHWPKLTLNARYPLVTERTSGSFLPQMLSLTDHGAVSFTKGCYLGQEIVARAQHRGSVKRHLAAYSFNSGSVEVGEKLVAEKGGSGVVVATHQNAVLAVASGNVESFLSERGASLTRVE
ncbi:MAG: hypothetical protein OXG24_07450, partial [Gammaproteobacteria bacterium]|nr:hypothetical protein [Gammaproteobacteria bacterium]